MKTIILFAVRCNPSITKRKLEKIESSGTASLFGAAKFYIKEN